MAKKQRSKALGVHGGQTKFNSIRKRPSGYPYKNHSWQPGQRCESTADREQRLAQEEQE